MAVDRRIPELPEGFILRRRDQLADLRDKIYLKFWYLASQGHVRVDSDASIRHRGSMGAIDWLAGIKEIPPGFYAPKFRVIEDLREIMHITELAIHDSLGRWEDTVRGGRGGAEEYFDRNEAAGALNVYGWARRENEGKAFDLTPEQAREAKKHFDAAGARHAAQQEADRQRRTAA